MTGEDVDNIPLKSLAAKWLFHQGASTVFAVVMLVGLFYVAPGLVREIREGNKEQAEQLRQVADKFDKEQDRTFQYLRELQLGRQAAPVASH
jgi:hypothetical protein